MTNYNDTLSFFKDYLEKENTSKEPNNLYQPIVYALSQGGKRIRPISCIMAAEMFDCKAQNVVYPALGIEIFHNFTLLHDDIMDQSPIRRGVDTVYKKWDTNTAILSGDTMFALAYKYIAKCETNIVNVLETFNQVAVDVCEGQMYDMDFETAENVSEKQYLKMIELKTACLLAASLKIGAQIADAKQSDIDNIYKFGINIGLAFQLKDDLLDVYADQNVFGKRIGNDILSNKRTFLYIKAFENANKEQYAQLVEAFNIDSETKGEEKIKLVVDIYNQLNIKEITEKAMEEYNHKAFKNLDDISVDDSKKTELLLLAKNLLKRDK